MFYAKLDAEGNLERYPYTLTDLRRDNPRTSFGRIISDADAAMFNCIPVQPAEQPAEDHTKNFERSAHLVDGVWEELWIESAATAEEIDERCAAKAEAMRLERTEKLGESDWTQLADAPLTSEEQVQWASYRQQLRDLPEQAEFPFIGFPAPPQ